MIELKDLEGKWYVNRSNFPMWLKGDKANPYFNYQIATRDSKTGLIDEVVFTKDGQPQNIMGFDELVDPEKKEFIWRGKGLMRLLKSRWKILYMDADKEWAIIKFDKTLFTPEGYEVISRYKNLSANLKKIVSQTQHDLKLEALLTPIYQV